MKKLLLIFIAVCMGLNTHAQERQIMMAPDNLTDGLEISAAAMKKVMSHLYRNPAARKTTLGSSRWYNYGAAMDTSTNFLITLGASFTSIALASQIIWNDTNGTVNYPSGLAHNTLVSQANIFDPKARLFNLDPADAYEGEIEITSTDAYSCDSVDIFGLYEFNNTKSSVVDTLRLVFTKGNGGVKITTDVFSDTVSIGGYYSGVSSLNMIYDSVTNTASGFIAGDLYKQDIYLTNTGSTPAWGDTLSNGVWTRRIAVNGSAGISATAGEFLGWSVTFISGDPATKGTGLLATPTPGDTLVNNTNVGQNKYNIWRPITEYYATYSGTTPTAAWAPYLETTTPIADHNIGLWKTLPNYKNGWDSVYVPLWDWNSGGNASTMQFPLISWHISCATCHLIPWPPDLVVAPKLTNATVSPNPASDEITIFFDHNDRSGITVSVTNMIGQTIAAEHFDNAQNGSASFNTSLFPTGMYIYVIQTNEDITTGRFIVTH